MKYIIAFVLLSLSSFSHASYNVGSVTNGYKNATFCVMNNHTSKAQFSKWINIINREYGTPNREAEEFIMDAILLEYKSASRARKRMWSASFCEAEYKLFLSY